MNSIGRASEHAIGNNTSPNEEIRAGGGGGAVRNISSST